MPGQQVLPLEPGSLRYGIHEGRSLQLLYVRADPCGLLVFAVPGEPTAELPVVVPLGQGGTEDLGDSVTVRFVAVAPAKRQGLRIYATRHVDRGFESRHGTEEHPTASELPELDALVAASWVQANLPSALLPSAERRQISTPGAQEASEYGSVSGDETLAPEAVPAADAGPGRPAADAGQASTDARLARLEATILGALSGLATRLDRVESAGRAPGPQARPVDVRRGLLPPARAAGERRPQLIPLEAEDGPGLAAPAGPSLAGTGLDQALARVLDEQASANRAIVGRLEQLAEAGGGFDGGGGLGSLRLEGPRGLRQLMALRRRLDTHPAQVCADFDERCAQIATDPRATNVMERMYFENQKTLTNFGYFAAMMYELLSSPRGQGADRATQGAARAAAAVAAIEQCALDGGRWDMAQLLLPMVEPPFACFHGRKAPRSSALASARTADPACISAAVAHLKDCAQIAKAREEARRD